MATRLGADDTRGKAETGTGMRTPEQIRAAITHLYAAREGAMKACAPPKVGVVVETADAKAARHHEQLRDENYQKVIILSRMIDALQWSLKEPSELAEWIRKFEQMDEIERRGSAARVA